MNKRAEKFSENRMGIMPVNKLLLSISVPMMISMLAQALYNIVDSIFVARLGQEALTAISLAFPLQMLMIAFGIGIGIGMNALLSKSLGERNFDLANKSANNGVLMSWISCVPFIFVGIFAAESFIRMQTDVEKTIAYGQDYLSFICVFSFGMFSQFTFERLLSSTGKTFYSMITQIIGAVVNVILDPIMIFGLFGFPRMEAKGAALATVIGQMTAAVVALYFNVRFNREIKLSIKGFRPDFNVIRQIYSVGLPATFMQAIGSLMLYGFNVILISFTDVAAAVFGVYFKLQSFVFMPVFGLNNGMVPIIAYNYGAGKKDRIMRAIKYSLIYAVSIMTVGMVIFQIFPEKLLLMFNATEEALSIGVVALRVISAHYLFSGFNIILISVFQAVGNGMYSLYISIARQLVVLLPVAWLLSRMGNLNIVWLAFPTSEIITMILCFILFTRVYNKKIKITPPA
ncbi:MAG: MATE family efflux transporter [Clostridiales bacterium]|jgi:putative MATE family efflux protein|nr:MATE family efflux transporter [Clostridiales bacterium]